MSQTASRSQVSLGRPNIKTPPKPRRAAPRRQRQALTAVWLGGRPRDVNLRKLYRRIALFRCAIQVQNGPDAYLSQFEKAMLVSKLYGARDRKRALTGNWKGSYGLRDEDYLRLKILTCTLPDENTRKAKGTTAGCMPVVSLPKLCLQAAAARLRRPRQGVTEPRARPPETRQEQPFPTHEA